MSDIGEWEKGGAVPDPWVKLRRVTGARIALGRAGGSLPTAPLLDFQLAHARARDAVHLRFDAAGVQRRLEEMGYTTIRVRSAADSRGRYLQRPDLGRRLDDGSLDVLRAWIKASGGSGCDAAFVIADGLSSLAVHRHGAAVLDLAAQALALEGWRIGPFVIAEQARVALGDEIGSLLGAEQVVVLLGERPGLSSADSLGIYLTYAPQVGRSDAERNCISNIHGAGLSCEVAARTLVYLMTRARALKATGVALKDESESAYLDGSTGG